VVEKAQDTEKKDRGLESVEQMGSTSEVKATEEAVEDSQFEAEQSATQGNLQGVSQGLNEMYRETGSDQVETEQTRDTNPQLVDNLRRMQPPETQGSEAEDLKDQLGSQTEVAARMVEEDETLQAQRATSNAQKTKDSIRELMEKSRRIRQETGGGELGEKAVEKMGEKMAEGEEDVSTEEVLEETRREDEEFISPQQTPDKTGIQETPAEEKLVKDITGSDNRGSEKETHESIVQISEEDIDTGKDISDMSIDELVEKKRELTEKLGSEDGVVMDLSDLRDLKKIDKLLGNVGENLEEDKGRVA